MNSYEDRNQLENQLGFLLYACSRGITRLYRSQLNGMGPTYPQYLVLLTLWENKNSTVTELGKELDLDPGTLTPLLRRMETMGLIRRRRDAADKRVVNITITKEGEALQHPAACMPGMLLRSTGMTEEEMGELNKIILRLQHSVTTAASK